jgi:ubiquinone/menaquinone biosynthesis C-methylase UbiE
MAKFTQESPQGPDSYTAMLSRRRINAFALKPVEFNLEGLRLAQTYSDPPLTEHDSILDVGCNSGEFVLKAAQAIELPSRIIGLDPLTEPYESFLPRDLDVSRFSFMQGTGEHIDLPDNAVRLATAHFVLYRSKDLKAMLAEMKRVVEPNGLIILSTNAKGHAHWRHRFEQQVARRVSRQTGFAVEMQPPAQPCYLSGLSDIIAKSGNLRIEKRLDQDTQALITPGERAEAYKDAIKTSVSGTILPHHLWRVWQKTVDDVVDPVLAREFAKTQTSEYGPHFFDPVHRGMLVLRNVKPD